MKYLILILISLNVNIVYGQNVHWITNTGVKTLTDCVKGVQTHSDILNISEYRIDCIAPVFTPILLSQEVGKSIVSINGNTAFICPMETAIFGTGDGFYIMLDCRTDDLIFKNSFEN